MVRKKKACQNEDASHSDTTKRSRNGRIRAIYLFGIQVPPGLGTISNETEMFKDKHETKAWHNSNITRKNRGGKPEMRPKQCVFGSRNGRIIME